jgi:hypothetical protein
MCRPGKDLDHLLVGSFAEPVWDRRKQHPADFIAGRWYP